MLTWTITDRATRVLFYGCLLLAAGALAAILAGDVSMPLMALALILVYQAWRLALARQVTVLLDETGITKTVGSRTMRLPWEQVTAVRFDRFLGSVQLVLRTVEGSSWNASDKLFTKLRHTEAAAQVPAARLSQVREFLTGRGMQLA